MKRELAALLAALLAAAVAAAALLADPTITVTYTALGGVSTGYTPLGYSAPGGVSTSYTPLDYSAPGGVSTAYRPLDYSALGGVSTGYTPLRYVFNTGLEVEGVSVPALVRVHVRLLKGGKAYPPDFDVEYAANGTKRVAKNGEDSIDITLTRLILAAKDPLVLEFPPTVNGARYSLVNSTTITVEPVPWGAVDVWVYYSETAQPPPPPPPPQPPTPPSPPQPPTPPPEEGRPAPEEAPLKGYVFIPPWLYELLREYWWLLLLLLHLLLLLLLLYLKRRREGVVIEIHVPSPVA